MSESVIVPVYVPGAVGSAVKVSELSSDVRLKPNTAGMSGEAVKPEIFAPV